ncbi:hypothetical protein DY000_02033110 [Brassica cretica]|uniref:Uncharacterized protein n=1 Tax=Brassica cretica TaxID=69181 RepID=A0ABQ7DTL2_BRACR|nr:hypothetical protein DY000_02033110 [Brassica cretica]
MTNPQILFSDLKAGHCRLIQGPITTHRLNTLKNLLAEAAVYEMHVFDLARSNSHSKLSDAQLLALANCDVDLSDVVCQVRETTVYLLHEKLVLLRVEPKVMIATNIYPKLDRGDHNQLSSIMLSFKNYINSRLCRAQKGSSSASAKHDGVKKLESVEDHPDDDMTWAVNLSMDSNAIVDNIGSDNTPMCDGAATIEGCSEVFEPIPPELIH